MRDDNGEATLVGRVGESRHARRSLIKGVAWSVPVVAVAAAAPMVSASPVRQTYTMQVAGSGTSKTECSFLLPAGATNIVYTVYGAGGGAVYGRDGGGDGALLSGTLSDTVAATTVKLVAAGGGQGGATNGGTAINTSLWGRGGEGFGNGGTSPVPSPVPTGVSSSYTPYWWYSISAGGGGGSALLIGGQAAVVAGGGGGGSNCNGYKSGANDFLRTNAGIINGGDGGLWPAGAGAGVDANMMYENPQDTVRGTMVAGGGQGGSTAGPGAGGTTSITPTAGFTTSGTVSVPGSAGSAGSATVGGNGANGVSGETSAAAGSGSISGYRLSLSTAGGGGGYNGGGSGSRLATNFSYLTASGVTVPGVVHAAGAGGGGSSFVTSSSLSGVVVTNTLAETYQNGGTWTGGAYAGGPGFAQIIFEAEPGLTFLCS